MDERGVKQVIKFIETNCETTLTPRQIEQLRGMKHLAEFSISKIRLLYRIAIDNRVYPECPYCKQSITSQEELTIDHNVPKSKGGTDSIENLQPMHKKCNSDKGSVMPELPVTHEVRVVKHGKHKNTNKHKEREIVKSRTPEELYQKCKKIDRARESKRHATLAGYTR